MTNQAELIKEMIQAIEYAEESAIYDTYGRANLSALVKVKRKALELLKGHENDWESTQAALKAAGCGVLAIHVESRITELEKDAARLKVILDAQDSDDEECQFAVMKNAHYDCYQSAEDLLEAIDTAKKKD